MSFTPTTWVEDSEPGISAEQLNRIEQGIVDATATTKTFTEKWQVLTIPSVGAWVSVNLSAYGVAAGDTVWITLQFAGNGTLYGGARAVGSSSQRTLGGSFGSSWQYSTLTLPAIASGAGAAIELYASNTSAVGAVLVGYEH
jgi:hypothetical protein